MSAAWTERYTLSRSTTDRDDMQVFKIMTDAQWAAMQKTGMYRGSADDKRDGFIHLSTSQQLAGTLTRHFANTTDALMLIAIDAESLGDKLKWEEGRTGEAHSKAQSRADYATRVGSIGCQKRR